MLAPLLYCPRGMLFPAIALFASFLAGRTFGQQAAPDMPQPPAGIVLETLRDSLLETSQRVLLLQHFLEGTTVDPRILRNTDIKSWRISSPAIRDSLFFALMQADSSVQAEAGSEAIVLATSTGDLIEVRFGNSVFKGIPLKEAINRSSDKQLYRKIATSYQFSRDIELRDPSLRLSTPIQAVLMSNDALTDAFTPRPINPVLTPANVVTDLSLTSVSVNAGPHWGGEARLGFDEVNLPFWSAGAIQGLISYDRVKFGIVLPYHGGRFGSDFFPPFVIRPRKLDGARGLTVSGDFGMLGGSVTVLRMTSIDRHDLLDPTNFYFPVGFLTAYYSFGIALDQSTAARAKLGLGIHKINHQGLVANANGSGTTLADFGSQFTTSPYLKFEYVVRGEKTERYHVGVQFYNLCIMVSGSMEIIPGILSFEASYLWPLASELEPWQNPDFFVVTPRIHIQF